MATALDIMAVLSLNSSAYDAGLAKARGTAEGFGTKAKAAFGGVVKGFALMGAAAGVFAGITVKTGAEFDKSMSQVAATLGITMEQLQDTVGETDTQFGHFRGNLREFAQFMGKNTAFSAKQASEALNYMALAGYDAQKSMDMLPNVLNLAAAGNMELATASDMVTDAQSALGLSTEETTKMVDELARASSRSNTSVEQLGSAILTVGGTAKNLKGGTTELATALGLLADNGTKGAEGGTALRNILMSISGKKFEKNFESMGVKAYDAQGNMRSLKDIFMDMNKAMDGMNTEEKTKLIQRTFNARDLKNVNALLGTSAERWDELTAAIENSDGAAADMAETQLDNLAGDITLLKSAFEGLQIAISDKLAPSFRIFVQAATTGISAVTDILQGDGVNGITSFAQALIGSIANAIPDAIRSIPDKLGDISTMLYDVMRETDPKYIAGGFLSGIIAAITETAPQIVSSFEIIFNQVEVIFSNLGEKFAPVAITMMQTIGDGLASAGSILQEKFLPVATAMIQSIGDGLANGIPVLMARVLPFLASLSEGIRAGAGALVDAGLSLILNLAQGLINSLPVLITYIPTIVTNIAGIINDNAPKLIGAGLRLIIMLAQGLIKAIPTLIKNIPAIVKAIFAAFTAVSWGGIGKSMVKGIAKGIKALAGSVKGAAGTVAKNAMSAIKAGFTHARELGANVIKAIGSALRAGVSVVVGAARALATRVISTIRNGFSNIGDVGMNLVRGIWNGISNGLGWIKGLITGWVGNVKNFIKGLFGIKSPSTWARDVIGANLVKGMALGIEDESDLVDSALAELVDVPDISIGTKTVGANEDLFGMMKSVQMVNNITVDGAENPEEYASRFVRQMQMDMRMV